MSDIFREVDEEIRKEQYLKLWKKYGPWVIGAAVLLVLAVAGYQGWEAYKRDQALAASRDYADAVAQIDAGDTEAALAELNRMADPGSEGYSLLAAFRRAELQVQNGDEAAAIETWNEIAASAAPPEPFRDLAILFAVMHQVEDGDPATLSDRLQPVAQSNAPFRPTALELQALLARKQGDTERAMELYKQVADGPDVPPAQRQRATQMLALLEG